MTERAVRKLRKELNAGTVAIILLSMLHESGEPMYGYEITRLFNDGTGQVKLGALYPVLRSMESQGLLESSVRPSDAGPARKYYEVTSEGIETLAAWRTVWAETRDRVDKRLEADNG